ncbi:MAG: PEP-CTERM sorting domain-containing protein [Myxococcota bacterium]|nr:PEP-CTERM sorting domain-containing protein [Myxococcota bacterium]
MIRIGDTALGILNLEVEGGDPRGYNVLFDSDTALGVYGDPPVFDWNSNDEAVAAVDAINDALNAEAMSADGPIEGVGGVSARFYFVPFGSDDGAFVARTGFRSDLEWELFPGTSENLLSTFAVYADFTVIPEPSTVMLLGLGFVGLGFVGRRRRGAA